MSTYVRKRRGKVLFFASKNAPSAHGQFNFPTRNRVVRETTFGAKRCFFCLFSPPFFAPPASAMKNASVIPPRCDPDPRSCLFHVSQLRRSHLITCPSRELYFFPPQLPVPLPFFAPLFMTCLSAPRMLIRSESSYPFSHPVLSCLESTVLCWGTKAFS